VTAESWFDERSGWRPADAAVERLLTAHAAAQTPDRAAMRRIRRELLHRIAAGAPSGGAGQLIGLRSPGAGSRRVLALLAATLLLGSIAGGAFAIAPGGPLYASRLWVEDLVLPSDPSARTNAGLVQLEARLDEVTRAAAAGNRGAVAAALNAYRDELAAVLVAAGGDLDREAKIQLHLAQHRLLLETLAANLPDAADAGIGTAVQNAIEHGEQAALRIDANGTNGNGGNASDGAPSGTGANGNGSPPARPDKPDHRTGSGKP
jgi:hypothetical protein